MSGGAPIEPRTFSNAGAMIADAARLRAACFAPRPARAIEKAAPPAAGRDESQPSSPDERAAFVRRWKARPDYRPMALIVLVAAVTGIDTDAIRGRYNGPQTVKARHIAYFIGRKYCRPDRYRRSLPALAEVFGRDHTTLMVVIKRIEWVVVAGHTDQADLVALIEYLWGQSWPRFSKRDYTELSRKKRGLPSLFDRTEPPKLKFELHRHTSIPEEVKMSEESLLSAARRVVRYSRIDDNHGGLVSNATVAAVDVLDRQVRLAVAREAQEAAAAAAAAAAASSETPEAEARA